MSRSRAVFTAGEAWSERRGAGPVPTLRRGLRHCGAGLRHYRSVGSVTPAADLTRRECDAADRAVESAAARRPSAGGAPQRSTGAEMDGFHSRAVVGSFRAILL